MGIVPKHRYVLGFMFDRDYAEVALILKNRPAWQAGKWNGIGGKIEGDETPHAAMVREFTEETYLVGTRDLHENLIVPDWKQVGYRFRAPLDATDDRGYEMFVFACTWANIDEVDYNYRDEDSAAVYDVPETPDPRRERVLISDVSDRIETFGVPGLAGTVYMAKAALIEGFQFSVEDPQ